MWDGLSDELKADYGEDFCRKVKGFMKNFRRKGVSYSLSCYYVDLLREIYAKFSIIVILVSTSKFLCHSFMYEF